MPTEDILVTIKDRVQTVQLNRPHKKNSITLDMYQTVTNLLRESANNEDVLVTVLTGTGDFYSSGTDLTDNSDLSGDTDPLERIQVSKRTVMNFVDSFIKYPKILVAIVNGPALGIAVTTLALCDVVYASDKAFLQTPFTRLGMSPEGCSSYTFPKLMGNMKATDMLLFGYKMSSLEAAKFGLVSEVYSSNEMLENIWNRIYNIPNFPQQSLLHSKRLMKTFDMDSLVLANVRECDELEERWKSEECHTAIMNFLTRASKL